MLEAAAHSNRGRFGQGRAGHLRECFDVVTVLVGAVRIAAVALEAAGHGTEQGRETENCERDVHVGRLSKLD